MAKNEIRERLLMDGPGALSDADLLAMCHIPRLPTAHVHSVAHARRSAHRGIHSTLLRDRR